MAGDGEERIVGHMLTRHSMKAALGTFALIAGLSGGPAGAQQAAPTSVLGLCLQGRPSDAQPVMQGIFDAQCPALLQSQFASANAANAASATAAQQSLETTQANLYASLEGLLKAPPTQVATGADLSNLTAPVLLQDAKQTFAAAAAIGRKLKSDLADGKAILAPASGVIASLLTSPVSEKSVIGRLDDFTKSLPVSCPGEQIQVLPLALAAVTAVTVGSTLASALQPSLVATGKSNSVQDTSLLIPAGLFHGLQADKNIPNDKDMSPQLVIREPAIDENNTVLMAMKAFRGALNQANNTLTKCKSAISPTAQQIVADANAYASTLTQVSTASPVSMLDIAAQKAQLRKAGVKYALVFQRDVSGGGVAAIKPNWFTSTQIMMVNVDGITYQLSEIESGALRNTDFQSEKWSDVCGLDQWTQAFTGCAGKAVTPASTSVDDTHH